MLWNRYILCESMTCIRQETDIFEIYDSSRRILEEMIL